MKEGGREREKLLSSFFQLFLQSSNFSWEFHFSWKSWKSEEVGKVERVEKWKKWKKWNSQVQEKMRKRSRDTKVQEREKSEEST